MRNSSADVQRGWRETDEHILFDFLLATRRGDYDAALELAPDEDRRTGWPAGKSRDWKAWIELVRLMKGQRDHEREVRRAAGRYNAVRRPRQGPEFPERRSGRR